jgi:hypothetical protein
MIILIHDGMKFAIEKIEKITAHIAVAPFLFHLRTD